MSARMGEYIVGAYLEMIQECDFISYNVRFSEGGLRGLSELDVVGFDFKKNIVYLCEVTTHILGFLYGLKPEDSVKKVIQKFDTQKEFAKRKLKDFKTIKYQSIKEDKRLGRLVSLNLLYDEGGDYDF